MKPENIQNILNDFDNAVNRLREGINLKNHDSIIMDGVIQRFEFTFELSWKLLKAYFDFLGIQLTSPRFVIKQAFKSELIVDGDGWIDMLEDRNKTTHIYNQEQAKLIYDKIINKHENLLKQLLDKMKKEIDREI